MDESIGYDDVAQAVLVVSGDGKQRVVVAFPRVGDVQAVFHVQTRHDDNLSKDAPFATHSHRLLTTVMMFSLNWFPEKENNCCIVVSDMCQKHVRITLKSEYHLNDHQISPNVIEFCHELHSSLKGYTF